MRLSISALKKKLFESVAPVEEATPLAEDGVTTTNKTNPGKSSYEYTYTRDNNGIRQTTGMQKVDKAAQRAKYDAKYPKMEVEGKEVDVPGDRGHEGTHPTTTDGKVSGKSAAPGKSNYEYSTNSASGKTKAIKWDKNAARAKYDKLYPKAKVESVGHIKLSSLLPEDMNDYFTSPDGPGMQLPEAGEPGGSTPSDEAHKLGLMAAGWGYWQDVNGNIVARTIDGHLTKLEKPFVDRKASDEPDEHEQGYRAQSQEMESGARLSRENLEQSIVNSNASAQEILQHLPKKYHKTVAAELEELGATYIHELKKQTDFGAGDLPDGVDIMNGFFAREGDYRDNLDMAIHAAMDIYDFQLDPATVIDGCRAMKRLRDAAMADDQEGIAAATTEVNQEALLMAKELDTFVEDGADNDDGFKDKFEKWQWQNRAW